MAQTSAQPPVRLALIGAGIFAKDAHLPSLLRLRDQFEIVAVYSRTETAAVALAQTLPHPVRIYTDLSALLADPEIEAVDIVLPIDVMPAVVAQALASGKHLISEKPIAPDVATARRLIDAYTPDSGPVWMVGENWRYEDAFIQASEMVQRGEIGRPVTCHMTVFAPVTPTSKYYHSAWRNAGHIPGGYLLDGGVHHVAAMRLVVGEIAAVSATTSLVNPHLPPVDTVNAALRFVNGVQGVYLASYAVGAPWPPYLHVVGEQGALRVIRGEIEVTSGGVTRIFHSDKFDGVQKELIAFATAIRQATPHRNPPAEALRDLAVVEAMLLAAQAEAAQGQWVSCL